MRRTFALTIPIAIGCLVLAGCSGSTNRSASGPDHFVNDGTFVLASNYDMGSFDPYHSDDIFGYADLAYDSLVHVQSDGRFVSGLAKMWTADANSATFTIRRDITCSDGSLLTASQIATDLNYVGDPKNGSPVYGVTIPTVPYTATGDDTTDTVKVVMAKPFGFLLNTIGLTSIVCAKGMANPSALKTTSDGTGPFVLTGVVPGQSYTFTVRKGYTWGPDGASTSAAGTPARLVIKVITNETTAANLLLTGQVNVAEIDGHDRQRLIAAGVPRVDHPTQMSWMWFNQLGGRAAADKRVRQALVAAVDLDQIVKVSTHGIGSASTGLTVLPPLPCPGEPVFPLLPKHDMAAASALLDQAGWTKGPDGSRAKDGHQLAIDMHFVGSAQADAPAAAELISEQWRALGIQVKLTNDTGPAIDAAEFQTGNYDVIFEGFGVDLPSQLVPFLSGPVPPTGQNFSGIDNPQYTALAAKAETMTPPSACTYWTQAEHALYRDVDLAPISNTTASFFLHNAKAEIVGFDYPRGISLRLLG